MKLYLKLMMVFPVLFLTSFSYGLLSDVFSQTLNDQDTTPNSWISERDDLNITMSLTPKVPTVDQPTELQFEIRELISGIHYNNLTANVAILDSDGRL